MNLFDTPIITAAPWRYPYSSKFDDHAISVSGPEFVSSAGVRAHSCAYGFWISQSGYYRGTAAHGRTLHWTN